MQRDGLDAEVDPAGPCGNLWLPAVLNRLQISRSGLLFDLNEQKLHVWNEKCKRKEG